MTPERDGAVVERHGDHKGGKVERLAEVEPCPCHAAPQSFPIDLGRSGIEAHVEPPAALLGHPTGVIARELRAPERRCLRLVVAAADALHIGLPVLHPGVRLDPSRLVIQFIVIVDAVQHGDRRIVFDVAAQHGVRVFDLLAVEPVWVVRRGRDDDAERLSTLGNRGGQLGKEPIAVLRGFVGDVQRGRQAVQAAGARRQSRQHAVMLAPLDGVLPDGGIGGGHPANHQLCSVNKDVRLFLAVRDGVDPAAWAAAQVVQAEPRHECGLAVAASDLKHGARHAPPPVIRVPPAPEVAEVPQLPRRKHERRVAVVVD